MTNIAGRILIIPKGDYDASASYTMLDLVSYNGTSWLARKDATGIEPSEANGEYWQSMFDFASTPVTILGDNEYIDARYAISGRLCFLHLGKATEELTLNTNYKVGVLPRKVVPSLKNEISANGRKWIVNVEEDTVYARCIGGEEFPEDNKPFVGYTMAVMLSDN